MSPTECTTTVWKRCFYIIWGIRRKVCLRQLDLIEFWSSSSQTSQLELKKLLGWEAKRLQELYQVKLPTTNLPTDTITWMTENLHRHNLREFILGMSLRNYMLLHVVPPKSNHTSMTSAFFWQKHAKTDEIQPRQQQNHVSQICGIPEMTSLWQTYAKTGVIRSKHTVSGQKCLQASSSWWQTRFCCWLYCILSVLACFCTDTIQLIWSVAVYVTVCVRNSRFPA